MSIIKIGEDLRGLNDEDAAGKFLFKSRLQGTAYDVAAALLNAYHATGSTGNEVILHN